MFTHFSTPIDTAIVVCTHNEAHILATLFHLFPHFLDTANCFIFSVLKGSDSEDKTIALEEEEV